MTQRKLSVGIAALLICASAAGLSYHRFTLSPGIEHAKTEPSGRLRGSATKRDSASITAAAIRQALKERRVRAAAEKAVAEQNTMDSGAREAKNEPALPSREAQSRVSQLLEAARKCGKLTAEDVERVIALQGQMDEPDYDVSVQQFQELLNSPKVDTASVL